MYKFKMKNDKKILFVVDKLLNRQNISFRCGCELKQCLRRGQSLLLGVNFLKKKKIVRRSFAKWN